MNSHTVVATDGTIVEYIFVGESMDVSTQTDAKGIDHVFGCKGRVGLYRCDNTVEILSLPDGRMRMAIDANNSDQPRERGFVDPNMVVKYLDALPGI